MQTTTNLTTQTRTDLGSIVEMLGQRSYEIGAGAIGASSDSAGGGDSDCASDHESAALEALREAVVGFLGDHQ